MKRPAGDIFLRPDGQGPKATFSEVFPDVLELQVDVVEKGPGNAGLGDRRFSRQSFREFVNCSNVQCSGHGLPMAKLLRKMTKKHETDYEGTMPCEGRLESGQACPNVFHIRMNVIYKEAV